MVVFSNFPIILNGILKTTIPLDKEGAMMMRHTFGHMDGFPGNTE